MANSPSASDKPPEKPPESGSVVLSARAVAIELLEAVLKRRKPLDDALAEHPDLERLVNRDRQFVRALVT
jgi:16S rRNA (cytosine967-C5)-methyltransferase